MIAISHSGYVLRIAPTIAHAVSELGRLLFTRQASVHALKIVQLYTPRHVGDKLVDGEYHPIWQYEDAKVTHHV